MGVGGREIICPPTLLLLRDAQSERIGFRVEFGNWTAINGTIRCNGWKTGGHVNDWDLSIKAHCIPLWTRPWQVLDWDVTGDLKRRHENWMGLSIVLRKWSHPASETKLTKLAELCWSCVCVSVYASVCVSVYASVCVSVWVCVWNRKIGYISKHGWRRQLGVVPEGLLRQNVLKRKIYEMVGTT